MSTLRTFRMSEATITTVTMQVLSMRISTIVLRTRTLTSGRAYPVLHAPALLGPGEIYAASALAEK